MHTDSRSTPRASQSRPLRAKLLGGVGLVVLTAAALAGCSSNASSDEPQSLNSQIAAAGSSAAGAVSSLAAAASSAVNAPNAGNDVIRIAAVAATGADSGEWQDQTLRLTFTSGSKGDTEASAYCQALEMIVGTGENATLIYPDGELNCPAGS